MAMTHQIKHNALLTELSKMLFKERARSPTSTCPRLQKTGTLFKKKCLVTPTKTFNSGPDE